MSSVLLLLFSEHINFSEYYSSKRVLIAKDFARTGIWSYLPSFERPTAQFMGLWLNIKPQNDNWQTMGCIFPKMKSAT